MAGKKRATKKTTGGKVARNVHLPATVDDYFDPETGELLNPKHEMFAQMRVQTFDNAKSLAAAGVEAKTANKVYHASRWLHRQPQIQRRVRAILTERVQELAVTEDWIVLEMLDLIRKGKTEVPITNRDGEILGYEFADLRTALGAAVKIGENLGMFQKKDNAQAPTVIFNMNYGPPEETQAKQITREVIAGEAKRLQ